MRRIFSTLSQKWPEYLLEIIVIVVGILGAFTLNNWNENRKDRQTERTLLQNIQEDVLLDTLDLSTNLAYHKRFLLEEKKFLAFLLSEKDKPEVPISYADVFGIPIILELHEASFNNLQNNDLGLVRDNELKQKISRHFDFFTSALSKLENDIIAYEDYGEKRAYFQQYFKLKQDSSSFAIPDNDAYFTQDFSRQEFTLKNLDAVKGDNGFQILLSESIFMRELKIRFYIQVIDRSIELHGDIETYLNL